MYWVLVDKLEGMRPETMGHRKEAIKIGHKEGLDWIYLLMVGASVKLL